jgi:hypothetical protein
MRAELPNGPITPYKIIGQVKPAKYPLAAPPLTELALREAMYVRISLKRRRPGPVKATVAPVVCSSVTPPDANTLVSRAHTVLVRYLPGVALPKELAKVRSLLERHMFGRDSRTHRDDAVRIAHQMDEIRPTP